MKITPTNSHVLVKPLESEHKTAGGILLPDNVKSGPQFVEILAVGPGSMNSAGKYVPLDVVPGQKALMSEYVPGVKINIVEQELILVDADDLLAIVQ